MVELEAETGPDGGDYPHREKGINNESIEDCKIFTGKSGVGPIMGKVLRLLLYEIKAVLMMRGIGLN